MNLKKRYYEYAKNHTEEELWQLFNEDLKNNVNSGSDYFSCEDYANLIKKVYCKNVVLSDSQMIKISLDVVKYAIFYQDKVNDRSFYFSHKQNVIMTYVFLVLCRNSGIDKFLMKDNQLNKLANNSKFQFLARKFFDYSFPLDKLEIYFSENVR